MVTARSCTHIADEAEYHSYIDCMWDGMQYVNGVDVGGPYPTLSQCAANCDTFP